MLGRLIRGFAPRPADSRGESGVASAGAARAGMPAYSPPGAGTPLSPAAMAEHNGEPAVAERLLRAAADLSPNDGDALGALGEFLLRTQRTDEARSLLEASLKRLPESAALLFACAHLARLSMDVDLAIDLFRLALAARPGFAAARFHLATQLFLKGQMREGFLHFRARREQPGHNTPFWAASIPVWHGESLTDKRLLIEIDWGGLGDEIQFARYIEMIHRDYRPLSLMVGCSAACRRLIAAIPGVDLAFVETGAVEADYHIGMMDIPCVYGTDMATIPAPPRYLDAPADDIAHWRQRLGTAPGLRVGLCWSAAYWGKGEGRSDKSVPLSQLAVLGQIEGLRFISLQKGAGCAELPCPGLQMEDYSGDLEDMADTAALIENLDVVVTVDTSVAHLAGALGKPVLMLLKRESGMFWLLERDISPWYRSVRILRQERRKVQNGQGDWAEVCAQAAAFLRAWPRNAG